MKYGLIGDPVERSVSHITHNHILKTLKIPAEYVKISVRPKELPSFLKKAAQEGFKGLSVTMPLKENILSLVEVCPSLVSVNTLVFKDERILGYNTDGVGALEAIEKKWKVRGKKVALAGFGGAAKAIGREATRRGALVTYFNRTKKEGTRELKDLSDFSYDLLINATPDPLPFSSSCIRPQTWVMDLTTKPFETLFLQEAKKKGCHLIYGYEMFIEQAILQFALWFPTVNQAEVKQIFMALKFWKK